MSELIVSNGKMVNSLPKIWVGYLIALLFLVLEIVEVNPGASDSVIVVAISGLIYWLYCIYKIHRVIAEASNFTHPITPGKAVWLHFIPVYGLYWIFHWPNEIASFVNNKSYQGRVLKNWPGVFILVGLVLSRNVDGAVGMAVIYMVGAYLVRGINSVVFPSNSTKSN